MSTAFRDILYVDDEPSNLFVFEAAFEGEFHVHTATSAADAMKILDDVPIPVVVADQRMPEMTGVELFSILRRRHPHIQRIILSGYTESEAIIDAVNQGQVFQFVQKPWERTELHMVLRRALDAHDLATQNSRLAERLITMEQMANLGQLAAEIAHEMGNQLTLLPLIEVIESDYSDDAQLQELAALARQTHEHLATLIEEIKSFVRRNRCDAPRSTSPFQRINLGDCIRELLSFMRFHRTISLAHVEYHDPRKPIHVLGDSFKLQQVLVNLLTNASDAIADRANGKIDIVLDNTSDHVRLRIRDNGCGIAPDRLNRIWESFYSTKGERGTGLGLDVVQNIVHAHRGQIWCESQVGCGTCFTITLPQTNNTTTGMPASENSKSDFESCFCVVHADRLHSSSSRRA